MQWIEDRFWVWIHYGTGKIGRLELFEAMEMVSYLRQRVIGPLTLIRNGKLPRGVRKIESDAPSDLPSLLETVAIHDAVSCIQAFRATVKLYEGLRGLYMTENLVLRHDAEMRALEYLDSIAGRFT